MAMDTFFVSLFRSYQSMSHTIITTMWHMCMWNAPLSQTQKEPTDGRNERMKVTQRKKKHYRKSEVLQYNSNRNIIDTATLRAVYMDMLKRFTLDHSTLRLSRHFCKFSFLQFTNFRQHSALNGNFGGDGGIAAVEFLFAFCCWSFVTNSDFQKVNIEC